MIMRVWAIIRMRIQMRMRMRNEKYITLKYQKVKKSKWYRDIKYFKQNRWI